MSEGAELATAGLVVAFAAVLLVFTHLFIEYRSVKGPNQNKNKYDRRSNMTPAPALHLEPLRIMKRSGNKLFGERL